MTSSVGPAGAGSGASASVRDLPPLPPTPLTPGEGIKSGWVNRPDGTRTKVARTVRVVPGLGIFIRDKTTPLLGSGSFSKAYKAQGYHEDGTPLPRSFVLLKLHPEKPFDIAPFKLLSSIPESPFLGGRPYKIFQHLSSKGQTRFSIITGLLGTDLFDKTLKRPLPPYWIQWKLLLKGLLGAAKGLKILHQGGLVHRDVKIENISTEIEGITPEALFDYGTLIRAGEFHPHLGMPLGRLPPEFLSAMAYLCPSWTSKIIEIFRGRNDSNARYLFERPAFNPDTHELPINPVQLTGARDSLNTSYQYQPSFDVFTLGYQFDAVANYFSIEKTEIPDFQRRLSLTKERRSFINSMQDPDPLKRPSIDEVVTFLEEYNLSIETRMSPPHRAEKPLTFTCASTSSPSGAKELFQQVFSRDKLKEGLEPGRVVDLDGKKKKVTQTKRTISRLGVFIRDKEKAPLGVGGFSTAYQAKGYHEDGTPLPRSFVLLKLNPENPFHLRPFELLSSLPESPFLGGRPYKIFQHLSSKQENRFSMIVDFLGPDLLKKLIAVSDAGASPLTQWKLLIKGLLDGAKGLEILHQQGLVHRDVTLSNISTGVEETSPGGIFDYGTLIRGEEFNPHIAAPLHMLPPEILHAMSLLGDSLKEKVRNTFKKRHTSIAHFLFKRPYPAPTSYSFPITPLQLTGLKKSLDVSCRYHPSFDIFTLGHQIDILVNTFPISNIKAIPLFQSTLKLTQEVILFINNMQHPDPLSRPSIREVIAFLEKYNSCINT